MNEYLVSGRWPKCSYTVQSGQIPNIEVSQRTLTPRLRGAPESCAKIWRWEQPERLIPRYLSILPYVVLRNGVEKGPKEP
jgi:hypothetical protein